MIIYNVTINVEDAIHDEWLKWQREIHVPEVLQTGLFIEGKMSKVLSTEQGEGHTYAVQYLCRNMEDFKQYEKLHAPRLRRDAEEKFKDKILIFRTLLEVVDEFKPALQTDQRA